MSCKDCPPSSKRPVVEKSGGRCATHWREEKQRRKVANHNTYVQRVYGLGDGEYESLYLFQGGRCAICRRGTGATKRLSVDHDHATGLVRGLLCGPCNQMLGHSRDDTAFFRRAYDYLRTPPYGQLGAPK